MFKNFLVILSLYLIFIFPLSSQESKQTFPLKSDISSLDGIMKAYYEVVSGPAGAPRQIERDRSLHHPDALIVITGKNKEGEMYSNSMTFDEFHADTDAYAEGFWEYEISREISRFGNIAHVWSTYAWSTTKDGPVGGRGINSIQLVHDGERWWLLSWMYDSERADLPIPVNYLPQTDSKN